MAHMAFNVQRRDGFYSIRKAARQMCRFIFTFTPVIQRLYPSNAALHAALAAANAACEALVAEIDGQATPGV
jgi:hypothetical protein